MNAARLRGKTIKQVHQSRFETGLGGTGTHWCIDAIEFTDGTFMQFVTVEGDGEYGTQACYPAKPPNKARLAGTTEEVRSRQ